MALSCFIWTLPVCVAAQAAIKGGERRGRGTIWDVLEGRKKKILINRARDRAVFISGGSDLFIIKSCANFMTFLIQYGSNRFADLSFLNWDIQAGFFSFFHNWFHQSLAGGLDEFCKLLILVLFRNIVWTTPPRPFPLFKNDNSLWEEKKNLTRGDGSRLSLNFLRHTRRQD